jgi:hypothetical protein
MSLPQHLLVNDVCAVFNLVKSFETLLVDLCTPFNALAMSVSRTTMAKGGSNAGYFNHPVRIHYILSGTLRTLKTIKDPQHFIKMVMRFSRKSRLVFSN